MFFWKVWVKSCLPALRITYQEAKPSIGCYSISSWEFQQFPENFLPRERYYSKDLRNTCTVFSKVKYCEVNNICWCLTTYRQASFRWTILRIANRHFFGETCWSRDPTVFTENQLLRKNLEVHSGKLCQKLWFKQWNTRIHCFLW